MLVINETYIKEILKEGPARLQEIHDRMMILYNELGAVDDVIKSASFGSNSYEGGTSHKHKDLSDIMIKHENLVRQRRIEIREEMWRLTEEEESINRIRVCYQTLKGKEYAFLKRLYLQRMPYKVVESQSGVSHSTFEKIRKKAILRILDLYKSNLSNQEIISRRNRQFVK